MSRRLKPTADPGTDENPVPVMLTPEHAATLPGMLYNIAPDGTHTHTGTVENLAADAAREFMRVGRGNGDWGDTKWAHGTFRGVLNCVVAGWQDGADAVDGIFATLTAKRTESMIPCLTYSDEADGDVDVEAWLSGEDECYIVTAPSPLTVNVAGTFATVWYDPFASCGQPAESLIKRGIYVAALVYVMERAGYRVALNMRMPNREYGSRNWLLNLTVKSHEQPLDLPRVCFWLGHPGVIRQLILTMYGKYRNDGVSPRLDEPTDGIITPQFTYDLQLDEWLTDTLAKNGLHFQMGEN